MTVSIKKEFVAFPVQEQIELNRFAVAVLTDLTALRTAIIGVNGSLDSDGGAGTGYAAAHDPADLTLVE